jgi:hypothetical protein
MFKRATLIAAAAMGLAAIPPGVAGAGDGGPGHEIKVNGLQCTFSRAPDPDGHRSLTTLAVFNTSGGVIPAGATVDVSFPANQAVRPLKASIVTRNDTATGNPLSLSSDPFTPRGPSAKVKCAASAHWVVRMPLKSR